MLEKNIIKPILYGGLASCILLGVYFVVLSLVSGWGFAKDQFSLFWYFIISLAIGFGQDAETWRFDVVLDTHSVGI